MCVCLVVCLSPQAPGKVTCTYRLEQLSAIPGLGAPLLRGTVQFLGKP